MATLRTETCCSVAGCECATKARGFCSKHYQRWLRHGDAEKRVRYNNSGVCRHRGCQSRSRSRGLCQTHYVRWLKSDGRERGSVAKAAGRRSSEST